MSEADTTLDTGTGYGMKPVVQAKPHLTQVGPGTPMGELMRRYWQPFYVDAELQSDRPHRVRLLGENLIAFRDKQGRPGLVYEHCNHRGTSLYYGRVEEDGIRCCNHGWLFDCKGNCVEQPAEVAGGRARQRYRQPWYPVVEHYGLLWAYMGPPAKKPLPPRWAHLEDLADDEYLEARSVRGYGPDLGTDMPMLDINWLSSIEQSVDGAHVPWLHYQHSGDQFTGVKLVEKDEADAPPYGKVREVVAGMVAERTELGVKQGFPMIAPNGMAVLSCNETIIPDCAYIAGFIDMAFFVPADDEHHLGFQLWRTKKGESHEAISEVHDGKTWWEMSEREHQEMPGDYEAQSSMPAPASNFEHFAQSDMAIVLWRRQLESAIKDVEEGRDPPGINFDPDAPPRVTAGFGIRPLLPEEMKGNFAIPAE
ncbi:Rieske 2Fe-2S domain-containing protein [Croceicoccus bisphenolivorans]|uniref:Rieske 2Fe-2S domain-containing protein n=1 Tax=Croceicoccus bisphenolivorans TaxID=1783232 RepID=UPI00082F641D|nr:Rieske 2Fe-2S domain-containing protein [Croceicoccus bisphenolivorans]